MLILSDTWNIMNVKLLALWKERPIGGLWDSPDWTSGILPRGKLHGLECLKENYNKFNTQYFEFDFLLGITSYQIWSFWFESMRNEIGKLE